MDQKDPKNITLDLDKKDYERYSDLYLDNKEEVIEKLDISKYLCEFSGHVTKSKLFACLTKSNCVCCTDCDCDDDLYYNIDKSTFVVGSNCLAMIDFTFDQQDIKLLSKKKFKIKIFALDSENNETKIMTVDYNNSKFHIHCMTPNLMFTITDKPICRYGTLSLNFDYMSFQ